MPVKNRDSLQEGLKRLESETIEQEQENVPLAPLDSEFRPLAEKDKKGFRNLRLPENAECGLTRILLELDSKEDITPSRQATSGKSDAVRSRGGTYLKPTA